MGMIGRLSGLASRGLVRREGPLSRQLAQAPGPGGLGLLPRSLEADQATTLVCGFCSTGCGLEAHLKDGEAVGLTPARGYPVNFGSACPKGWEALAPLAGPGRATVPMLRRGGRLVPVSWQAAVTEMVSRFRAIQERYGPASVAWLGTGQLVTEELALLGALGKFGMGMLHGDGNTRQCMATSVVAYKECFGFDAPPFTYADLEESDVLVFVGANPCIAHPILWQRVCKNPHRPKLVVIDPRRTETAMAATHHYALRPKSDLVLLYAVARLLIERGWIDRAYVDAYTSGFEAYRAHVARFTPAVARDACGLSEGQLTELAELIHAGKRVSFWWTMGVNQSHEGVRTAQAVIALALLTGNLGRPGTGANSLTGQCNAMGSRLFSNTTSLLGGRDFANATHRAEVARVLELDEGRIPRQPSLAYDQILEAILDKKIRALWIVATNPAHSWINQTFMADVLSRLECLVVQDLYVDTETAARADILLPAAGWGEKEGTFINSERRLGVVRRVRRAPGEALADFHIFQLVAEAWGAGRLFRRWSSPEAVFRILRELSLGMPCDFGGIEGYAHLAREGGLQWPLPPGTAPAGGERRLFEDGRFFTADGRARLICAEPRPLPEPTSAEYPLVLITGRGTSSQWHTETRTRRSAVLRQLSPSELHLEISPADARALGLVPGEAVTVASQRGSVVARAFITHVVRPGQVFLPMHHPGTNRLTFAAFDPHSRQPAYKACAVRVCRLDGAALGRDAG